MGVYILQYYRGGRMAAGEKITNEDAGKKNKTGEVKSRKLHHKRISWVINCKNLCTLWKNESQR